MTAVRSGCRSRVVSVSEDPDRRATRSPESRADRRAGTRASRAPAPGRQQWTRCRPKGAAGAAPLGSAAACGCRLRSLADRSNRHGARLPFWPVHFQHPAGRGGSESDRATADDGRQRCRSATGTPPTSRACRCPQTCAVGSVSARTTCVKQDSRAIPTERGTPDRGPGSRCRRRPARVPDRARGPAGPRRVGPPRASGRRATTGG